MAKVLVIDDDVQICKNLGDLMFKLGHDMQYCHSRAEGIELATTSHMDIVFLDVKLPDGSGLDILPKLREQENPPEVIIMTGLGDAHGAELAITSGAWRYSQKPLSPKEIIVTLQSILEYKDNICASSIGEPFQRQDIIGESHALKNCLKQLQAAAQNDTTVLISGETGTGKELFARALHENSLRRHGEFVVVDCASIPENLMESILFGHIKGSFTGAVTSQTGLAQKADGGTLFLDEIGDLAPPLQKKMLRVLQEKRFRPVGSETEISSDFRVVAATNRDLAHMVKKSLFREDLLYRLRAANLYIPPLRKRMDDISLLTDYISTKKFEQYSITEKDVSQDLRTALLSYDWPGNVRELFNAIEVAINNGLTEPTLFSQHLPEYLRIKIMQHLLEHSHPLVTDLHGSDSEPLPSYKDHRKAVLHEADREYFTKLMQTVDGNINDACVISGIGRSRLYLLLKQYDISRKIN